jgi:hypothetical protein
MHSTDFLLNLHGFEKSRQKFQGKSGKTGSLKQSSENLTSKKEKTNDRNSDLD